MAWVAGDDSGLVGGGTEFPLLRQKMDARWCRFVECPASGHQDGAATVFKPIAGNAVYWENFRSDGSGRGYDETWHAGLPVVEGVKVGLNIWSWGRIE
jgi:prolyl 4-hydroxylase